ncbi:hypothetical protein KSS87_015236 [Heliosperma pusillum]|nr:hypothetical protein KSS87_011647 [Heliosperma pusillum]KAH9621693.1 hypothetical protein KSS87_015236 [Heliosperma pusillum]
MFLVLHFLYFLNLYPPLFYSIFPLLFYFHDHHTFYSDDPPPQIATNRPHLVPHRRTALLRKSIIGYQLQNLYFIHHRLASIHYLQSTRLGRNRTTTKRRKGFQQRRRTQIKYEDKLIYHLFCIISCIILNNDGDCLI